MSNQIITSLKAHASIQTTENGTPTTPSATCKKTAVTASEIFEGLKKSKFLKAALIAGTVGLIVFCLASTPIGWIATALSITILTASIAFGMSLHILTKLSEGTLEFEASALHRLFMKKDFDPITVPGWTPAENAGALVLGSLPNRLRFSEGEKILQGNGAVLSLNEPWERKPLALSMPYTAQDWEQLGVDYLPMDVLDHTLLSCAQMDEAADWIHMNLEAGKNVYVHCRAGVGRSATAIAAYLMKYGKDTSNAPLSLEAICSGIKDSRKRATVWNKLQALRTYDDHLKSGGIPRPDRSSKIQALIDKMDQGAKKLSKAEIAEAL